MRGSFVVLTIGALSQAIVCGQDFLKAPRFPNPSYFRQHFAERMPRVELRQPDHLQAYVVNSRFELSLRAYLELVLANNTDIQIQRLGIEVQQNDITRSYAPFDPSVIASFQSTRATTPSDTALAGADTLSQLKQPIHFVYQRMLENGTQVAIGFDGAKSSSNDTFSTFNPALSASFNVGFTQPLLRNRGAAVNKLPILIARTRYQISRFNLEDQLSRLLQAAEDLYWDLTEARENLRVQQDALTSLNDSLKRSQRELELGEIAPVEIYQAQQVVASEEALVVAARSRIQQGEDAIRHQIGADLDPRFRAIPIELTESLLPPYDDERLDREGLIETAYQKRRDMEAAVQSLSIDDMTFELRRNALLPDVSMVTTYRSSGRGGRLLERSNVFSNDGSGGDIVSTVPGGLGDALGQVFRLGYPTYAVSLNVAFPIRDRRGVADLADAAVTKRLDALRLRALQQQIRLDVSNAASRVEASRDALKLSQVAVDFARKRVDAEQRKFELGATTIFFLLDAQNSHTRAEADLVVLSAQYRHDLANLLRVTGKLPEERGVLIQ